MAAFASQPQLWIQTSWVRLCLPVTSVTSACVKKKLNYFNEILLNAHWWNQEKNNL